MTEKRKAERPRLEDPLHPGEVLMTLYLEPLAMTAEELAARLDMPGREVQAVLCGQAPLTADMALRLSVLFATTPEYWLNMQRNWDLAQARRHADLSRIVPLDAA